jgi:hypothetical protein
MGHSYVQGGASNNMGDFTVVKSNPSGMIVRFTVTDTAYKLTTSKMIRMVIGDAIDQFIVAERTDLDTNGDTDVKGSNDYEGVGDGFIDVVWNFAGKYAELTLTALTNIAATGNITVSIPYADVC